MAKINTIKTQLTHLVLDILGWHTNEKIIVFESDDWGAIRMASRQSFNKLEELGYEVGKNAYERNDSLESLKDLENLSSLLSTYCDQRGLHPIFTLNYVMCNPNFQKIKESNYEVYSCEPITETYKHYYGDDDIIGFVKNNIQKHLFMPQFHAKEHINIFRWMEALKNDSYGMRRIMDLGCASTHIPELKGNTYVRVYDAHTSKELECIKNGVKAGLEMFETLFGFKSTTAISPNYIWDTEINTIYKECGVKLLQGGYKQICSTFNNKKIINHYLGHSKDGLYHSVRNCTFECSHFGKSAIDRCLDDIKKAFKRRKPAIICTHRLNYISSINPDNAIQSLEYLNSLLKKITLTYPDVIFMSSDELFEYFMHKYNLK